MGIVSNNSFEAREKSGDRGTKHAAGLEHRESSSPVRVYLIPTSRFCCNMARG